MQLPQHIIDLVGTLFDQGQDDETIIFAVLQAWRESCMLRSDQVSGKPSTPSEPSALWTLTPAEPS